MRGVADLWELVHFHEKRNRVKGGFGAFHKVR